MLKKLLIGLLLIAPLGFYPFLRSSGTSIPEPPAPPYRLTRHNAIALHCLSISPAQPFPAGLPWVPLKEISEDQTKELTELAEKEPIKFLERCLAEYEKSVEGYRCTFLKQERVKGKLRKAERIVVHFREKPFSVHMDWKEGQEACIRSMYVEGQNKGQLRARGLLFDEPVFFLVSRPVDAADAKATSRFPITNFGMYLGAKSTLHSVREAEKNKALHLKFEGIEQVKQLGNRPCYKFTRFPYQPAEDDGIAEMTFYIDQETLMQTGSILRNAEKELIAEYFFRDIELNPTFSKMQFTDKAL